MSEMLHQPAGGLETYPKVEVPETEIHKIPDMGMEEAIECFEKEGYVSNEELIDLMSKINLKVGNLLEQNKGRDISHEQVLNTEKELLKKEVHNSNEKILVKVLSGIIDVNRRDYEREKNNLRQEQKLDFNKEDTIWQRQVVDLIDFLSKRQNCSELIEQFWQIYNLEFKKILEEDLEIKSTSEKARKTNRSGILGALAAIKTFREIGAEVEQSSIEDDVCNAIDLIIKYKDKSGNIKIYPVQVKCKVKERLDNRTLENIVYFYSRFDLRNKNQKYSGEDKNVRNFKKGCFEYEKEQRKKGNKSFTIEGDIFINFVSKVASTNQRMVNNKGEIANEELKDYIKNQLKLQLELN